MAKEPPIRPPRQAEVSGAADNGKDSLLLKEARNEILKVCII